MIRISCTNAMVPGKSLTEQAQTLRRWGFDAIAVFADYATWTDEAEEELLSLEERTGITPCEFVFSGPEYGHLMANDPELREQTRQMYRRAAEVCAKCGAVTELEYTYGPVDPLPLFTPYQKMSEADERVFLKSYGALADTVLGTEAYVLLENINRYESPYLNSVEHCAQIVEKLGHPNAGILADLFHMSIEERSIPETIRRYGHLFRHVHLGDNNRLLPGYGSTDWKACFRALKEVGYDRFVNLECGYGSRIENIQEAASFLRELIANA